MLWTREGPKKQTSQNLRYIVSSRRFGETEHSMQVRYFNARQVTRSLVRSPGQGLRRTLAAWVGSHHASAMGHRDNTYQLPSSGGGGSLRDDDDAIMHPAKNFSHALRHGPSGDGSKGIACLVVW